MCSEKLFRVTFKQETSRADVPGECGVLLSLTFFSAAVPLLRAMKMCEIFDKSREQMLICLPPPPRGPTCVRIVAKN